MHCLLCPGELEEGDVELEEGVHGEDEPRVGHHVILHLVVVCKIAKITTQNELALAQTFSVCLK